MDNSVVKGEIDNRIHGIVKGRFWLLGRADPIVLSLKGNCHRDMAGCLVSFENPTPESGDMIELNAVQIGTVGDMTASRKVRVLDVPAEEAMSMAKAGQKFPEHMGNCVYFEWFSECNGRVVIESVHYRVSISAPEWTMSQEEEVDQIRDSQKAIHRWMADLTAAMNPSAQDEAPDDFDDGPMDEFEWERSLKESDALTEKFGEVLEKYIDHPDRDQLIAQEMGWDWIEDTLSESAFSEAQADAMEIADTPPPEPNPLTEGVDWIRSKRDRITHPLTERAFQLAIRMRRRGEQLGLNEAPADSDFHEMVFQAQTLSAKLAGALDSIGYDHFVEGGFVVACLKRALQYFDRSIAASEKVRRKQLIDVADLNDFRRQLFEIREEMLRLIARFREKL
ncbi:MAG TPA: hypothetical protein DCZ95_04590 [Verrucomicrobia bacterium]|nr:MAG: hypothetical protein A2X46_14500 [Lentisphaerae bacterium GWF2_57_35]HBA83355.1 hypothetical protein [Verrucomicrobiota bacterium]